MTGELIVREAKTGDADALAQLIGQLGYEATPAQVAERMLLLSGPGRSVLVGIIDNAVVGCLTTSMMHVLHRPAPVGRMSMMVVDEGHRSTGIGAAMVRAAERQLAEDGCYMIEVTSQQSRIRAHGFWEAQGYEKTSVRLAKTL